MRRSTGGLGQICFDVDLEMLPNLNFRKHSLVLTKDLYEYASIEEGWN